jgi:hypothetical protein
MTINQSRRHLLLKLAAVPLALGSASGHSLAHPVSMGRVGITLRWLSEEVFPSFPQRHDALQTRRVVERGAEA